MSSVAVMWLGLLMLLLLATAIVTIAVVSSRSRSEIVPRPRSDGDGRYAISAAPLPPKVDATYRPPASQATTTTTASEAGEKPSAARARPPRRIVNCPRCQQAILNDESLVDQRVACPICNCKFFLPRDT